MGEEPEDQLEMGKGMAKNIGDPWLTTAEEAREHYLSCHMPYCTWCYLCVMGGREKGTTCEGGAQPSRDPGVPLGRLLPGR